MQGLIIFTIVIVLCGIAIPIMKKKSVFLIMVIFFSCQEKIETITVSNEYTGCEANTTFWKIIECNDKEKKGDPVLLTPEILPLDTFVSTRFYAKLKGNFSYWNNKNYNYGCIGSPVFNIKEIVFIEDIGDTATFKIGKSSDYQ